MAVKSLGQLTMDLVARVGGFMGPLDKASRQLKKSAKGMAGDLTNIAKGVGTFSAAASAAVVSVAYLVDRISQNAVEMQKFAKVAGTSVTELQSWGAVTESMGVSTEKLSDILKDLNDRLGEFSTTGSGELKDFFDLAKEVGVTIEDFEGLSGAQSLQLVIETIDRLGLSSQQATFILESLADEASALSGLSSEAAQRAADLAAQLENMGIAQDAIDGQMFAEYAQSAGEAKAIVSALATTFASELVPYITEVLDKTIEYGGGIEDLDETFRGWVEGAIIGLGHIANGFHQFQEVSADTDVAIAQIRRAFAGFIQDALEGVADLVRSIEKAEPALDALDRVFGGAGIDISAAADAIDQMGSNLVELADTNLDEALGRQARTAAVDYVESAKEIIEAARERREAAKEAGAAESERERVTRTLIDTTNESSKADKEAAREAERLAEAQQSLIDRLYPAQAAWAKYREEIELLELRAKTDEALDLADALTRLDTEMSRGLTGGFMGQVRTGETLDSGEDDYWAQWLEGAEEAFTNFDELAGGTIDNFSSSFGDAFESMIFDAESLGDAVQGMAEGMARSMVSALGEMAAQWLVYQAVQAVAGETTASASAEAMASNAAATSLQAGLSAYASTAAIPIVGPVAAPAAMQAALTATAPLAAGVASLAAVQGMAHEGIDSVPKEGTWLLDEGERVLARPQADKLDAFLAQGGRSGSSNITVNVIEDKSRAGEVAQSQGPDEQMIIDVVVANIAGDREVHDLLTTKYPLETQGK